MNEKSFPEWLEFLQQDRWRVSEEFMAGIEDLPVQQREFEERGAAKQAGLPISDLDRRKRKKAVDFARASLGLSKFEVSEESDALALLYVNGEIELAEFVEISRRRLSRRSD